MSLHMLVDDKTAIEAAMKNKGEPKLSLYRSDRGDTLI
jgi:hypothetical protein